MDCYSLGNWLQISSGGTRMKRIRTKLWFGMMILVGAIIVLLWLFQIVFLEQFYSSIELNGVSKRIHEIVKEIEEQKYFEKLEGETKITDSIEQLVYEKQLSVQVIDTSYNIRYELSTGNHFNESKKWKEVISEVLEKALLGEESKADITHPKFSYQFKIIAIPIYQNEDIIGAMITTIPMAPIDDAANILKKQIILISIILFLISLILSFQLSKRFSKPILAIRKVAESYSMGNYKERVEIPEKDEIGQLANRMNAMGESLSINEELKRELIANVSHELRTPLTLIRGYAETLRDVTGGNPQKREKQLGVIIEETQRLGSIVEDILNLSQLQAGAIHLVEEPFVLQEMIQAIKSRYELQKENKKLQVAGLEETQEILWGDKKRIEQVFYNLINNAFAHTEEAGIVEIVITNKKERVKIEIKDHGEGIAEEELTHIFERYYKGKRSGENKEHGIGLGLSIVKNILELHNVEFGVESEVGKGSIFWFELYKEHYHTSF